MDAFKDMLDEDKRSAKGVSGCWLQGFEANAVEMVGIHCCKAELLLLYETCCICTTTGLYRPIALATRLHLSLSLLQT